MQKLKIVKVENTKYREVALKYARNGYRLLTVSAIHIGGDDFEIYLILHRDDEGYIKISSIIKGNEAPSVSDIWKNAGMHEREVHELFGIKFIGNPCLEPLLTEWEGPPPFRKDFDWREYKRKMREGVSNNAT